MHRQTWSRRFGSRLSPARRRWCCSAAPNPGTAHGASVHRELELLVRAGLSPVEALHAATAAPADAFGLDDRGRIAPGMKADLVRGDATRDVLATRDLAGIWKDGVRVERVRPEAVPAGRPRIVPRARVTK